jgi:acyl-CoA synthetase (NDP forming)
LAAASHSAGGATPRAVRDALFAQAGVLAVDEITELPGLLALLCRQPLPACPRVAVLSNAGGAGVLAADACVRAGLQIAVPETGTRAALTALLPGTAAVADPVDTTATVPAAVFGRALELLLSDPGVDAVLALGAPTGTGDPLQGVGPIVAAGPGKPVATVRLGQAETVTLPVGLHPDDMASPVFAEPAAAARALAAAARRATWLRRPSLPARTPLGVDATAVHVVVADAINRQPEGGWFEPQAATALARSAGLPVLATTVVHGVEAAVRTWRKIGGPVAVKADVPGVLHKRRAGAVATGLDSSRQVSRAVRGFRQRFGSRLRGILVQPMASSGVELLVGVTVDPLCGPLLTLGLGGTSTDLVDDRTHCLMPVMEADLDDLLDGLHATPGLIDGGGPASRAAVRDVANRLAWLAEQVPEIAEAEINPLTVDGGVAVAVDIRIRLAPALAGAENPWLRRLPT